MRYGYKYHDHQGNIKIGEIESPTREEAFQALKGSGVKPMQFWTIEEPPSKRRFSVRWVLIALLSVALCFALYLLLVGGEGTSRTPAQSGAMAAGRTAMPRARRQGVLAHAEADRPLAQIFKYKSERSLALFAEPGSTARQDEWPDVLDGDLWDALKDDLKIAETECEPVIELMRVVAGIKDEVAQRLVGGMSLEEVTDWLVERQYMEADFRDRLIEEEEDDFVANARLRSMGLREIGDEFEEIADENEAEKKLNLPPCQTATECDIIVPKSGEDRTRE